MVYLYRFSIVLLLLTITLTPAYAQEVDDLLESDEDADLFEDNSPDAAPDSAYKEIPNTMLLDILPMNSTEEEAQWVYQAVMEALKQAEDLAPVDDNKSLIETQGKHPINKCRSIDNKRCIRQLGQKAEVRYLVYGELRDMDDVFLIILELMDIEEGRVLQDVRTQIVKPTTKLKERSAAAACRLTRFYGCEENELLASGLIIAPAPTQASKAPAAQSDDSYFEDEPGAEEQTTKDEPSDDEPEPVAAIVPEREKQPEPLETREESKPGNEMEIAGWTLVGVGGAAAISSIATTAMMFVKYDEYNSIKATEPNAQKKSRDKKEEIKTLYWTSIGLGAGAIVSGGLATLFLLLDESDSEGSAGDDLTPLWSAAPMYSPEGSGVLLNCNF